MRSKLFLGLALATALAAGGSVVAADSGTESHAGWHHGHHDGGMMALHQLNLTDAQKAQVKQIMQTSFAQSKPQRDAVRQKRDAFEAMTPDASGYQAAAASLAQAEASSTQARVLQRADVRAQVYRVLTPAQRSQMATLKAQHEARRAQWKTFREQNPVNPPVPAAQ